MARIAEDTNSRHWLTPPRQCQKGWSCGRITDLILEESQHLSRTPKRVTLGLLFASQRRKKVNRCSADLCNPARMQISKSDSTFTKSSMSAQEHKL